MNWTIGSFANASPGQNEIVCWRVLLDDLDEVQLASLYGLLVPDEKLRANAFLKPVDRNRYIAAHGVLRILGKHILGFEVQITANAYGKPQFLNAPLQFNLSHSGNVILLAFSLNSPVGVDVEQKRAIDDLNLIAANYFHQSEVRAMNGLAEPLLSDAFFSCWSKKEAVVKALGLGLSLPLNAFEVDISPLVGDCAVRPESQLPPSWTLWAFCPLKGYSAALASPQPKMQLRFLEFSYVAMQQ